VRSTAEARIVKPGTLMQAARVALTGRTVSPGLFDVIELLGREESSRRLEAATALVVAGP
jgi:glutamyl-tRNA synthetase